MVTMGFELRKEVRTVKFMFKGRPEERKVEVRFDPITGRRCRILEKAILVPPGTDYSEILEEKDCPFCGTNLEDSTPRFMLEESAEGRLTEGRVVLIPNLFPYADHTAVVVFKEHFKPVDGFSKQELVDALVVAQRYLGLAHKADPGARFASINWNYMPPSGGTLLHPHLQVILDRYPTFLQELLLKGSETRPGIWKDIIGKEKELGERYIENCGKVHLFAPFAPMGFDQVDGVVEGVPSIAELGEKDLRDLAAAIRHVLEFYGRLERSSFNMAIYSSPFDPGPGETAMWLNFKILGRSNMRPFYRSDAGYTERLHYESVVNKPPEKVATQMRDMLGKRK